MANPRKFSEKIALQKQKQAEGTAEFEKIMKEVSAATSKIDESHYNQRIAEGSASPGAGGPGGHRESRGRSVGVGPMRRPSDRKVDRSPYSSGNIAYLSPPSDSYWRRASSDSAIHQSLIQTSDKHHGSHSPISLSPAVHRRSPHINSNLDHRHSLSNSINRNSSNVDIRQGSPNCSPRLPCVNAYSSPHDNSLTNSVGNNTGSLPDLSSVHFATSLCTQLEKENEHSSSPFSSSPLTTSPTTLSPTSMPNRYQYSPAHSPSDSNTYSPTHITTNARRTGFDHYRTPQGGQTSHLSFTNLPGLVHVQQGCNMKNSNISNNNTIHGSHGHLTSIGIVSNMTNPNWNTQSNFLKSDAGNLTEYRNPQSRPSPGSSPGILPSIPLSESNPSAPCSPIPQNINNSNSQTYDKFQNQTNDGYSLNQSFQNHFEQFSLVDNTSEYIPNLQTAQNSFNSLQFDEATYAQLGSLSNPTQQQSNQINRDNYMNSSNVNMNKNDIGNNKRIGNSNLAAESPQESYSSHHNNYQNPATPTSIPEIVFSDFSSGNPDFSKEIFGSLDLELGPMDVAGLQMLSDPNSTMIADPTIEDSFRRDLN